MDLILLIILDHPYSPQAHKKARYVNFSVSLTWVQKLKPTNNKKNKNKHKKKSFSYY